MEAKLRYTVHYILAWEARRWALDTVFGDWVALLKNVPTFLEGIDIDNPEHVMLFHAKDISVNIKTLNRVL